MKKENLFPKLIGRHNLSNEKKALLEYDDNGTEITVIQYGKDSVKTILHQKGEKAEKSIKELDHLCWGGLSPNQAIEKWLTKNLKA